MTNIQWARWYRARGYNPLPSVDKRPEKDIRPSLFRQRYLPEDR